jgi:hypothetical protein
MNLRDWDDFYNLAEEIRAGITRKIYADTYGAIIVGVADACRAAGLDLPKVGPCSGCEHHEINRPDGATCAAGECIEEEA